MYNCLTRRNFLITAISATAGVLTGCRSLFTGSKKTEKIRIGMQLYCVRKACAKDFSGTLKKVAQAGFEGVEFADYFGYSAQDIRNMLDEAKLEVCGTHIYKETLMGDQLEGTIAFNKALRNRNLIVRSFPEVSRREKQAWLEFADQLNAIAKNLKTHDMRVGYHNHNYEFIPLESGEMPWDLLADNTTKDVILQLDTGNSSQAGIDPLDYLERNPGRTITSHIKPFSATNETAFIGDDEINWEKAINLYEKSSGIEWYIIEYEHELEQITPLESLKANMENFKKIIG